MNERVRAALKAASDDEIRKGLELFLNEYEERLKQRVAPTPRDIAKAAAFDAVFLRELKVRWE